MLLSVLALALSQAPEIPQARPPEPFKGVMVQPRLVKQTKPDYPMEAYLAGLGQMVILECEIDKEGRVTEAKVLRGDQPLADAAVKAVKKWRYEPLKLAGVATGFMLTVTVNFDPRQVGSLSLNVTNLVSSLESKHEAIRESAAHYLGGLRVGPTVAPGDVMRAVKGLKDLLQEEESRRVRAAATKALAQLEP